jgi:2-polyprenyl-6-hydroxyphenyl methylase/3-demethylubiquinone-9 3-methyltransferase
MNNSDKITFSFGKNWKDYLSTIDEQVLEVARNDIEEWIGTPQIRGKKVVDVGSGSGLSSLCFHNASPAELVSFDYDEHSVEATKSLRNRAGDARKWKIIRGSILDKAFLDQLGLFDVVYSWGVLHHTGRIWAAIENAQKLCKVGGLTLISIYQAGDLYRRHLALKKNFNNQSSSEKQKMIEQHALERYPGLTVSDAVNRMKSNVVRRGMNEYNDLVDWLGGLPYEVAYPSEVISRFLSQGFLPIRVLEEGQGGCNVYLFRKEHERGHSNIDWKFNWSHAGDPSGSESRTLVDQISHDFATAVQERQFPLSGREVVVRAAKNRLKRIFSV